MAFEVQDPDVPTTTANSYLSVADWKTYCDDRGHDYSGATDSQIQQGLIRATDYTDVRWTFEGQKYDCEQSTEVPRGFFYDENDCPVEDFPRLFLNAVSEYAKVTILDGKDLMPNPDNTNTQHRTLLRTRADVVEKEQRWSAQNSSYKWPRWGTADRMMYQSGLIGPTTRTLGRG